MRSEITLPEFLKYIKNEDKFANYEIEENDGEIGVVLITDYLSLYVPYSKNETGEPVAPIPQFIILYHNQLTVLDEYREISNTELIQHILNLDLDIFKQADS